MRFPIVVILFAAVAALFLAKPPEDRPEDYQACLKLYPERHCRFEHLPATFAQEESHGRR